MGKANSSGHTTFIYICTGLLMPLDPMTQRDNIQVVERGVALEYVSTGASALGRKQLGMAGRNQQWEEAKHPAGSRNQAGHVIEFG